jgi:hypothetical protein
MFHMLEQSKGMGSRLAKRQKQTEKGLKTENCMIGQRVLHDKRWMHVGSRKSKAKQCWQKEESEKASTVH